MCIYGEKIKEISADNEKNLQKADSVPKFKLVKEVLKSSRFEMKGFVFLLLIGTVFAQGDREIPRKKNNLTRLLEITVDFNFKLIVCCRNIFRVLEAAWPFSRCITTTTKPTNVFRFFTVAAMEPRIITTISASAKQCAKVESFKQEKSKAEIEF